MTSKDIAKPPQLAAHDKANFATLQRAHNDGRLALLSAIRKSDQKPVALVCGVGGPDDENMFGITPFAVMVEGNPFELFEPPMEDSDEQETR